MNEPRHREFKTCSECALFMVTQDGTEVGHLFQGLEKGLSSESHDVPGQSILEINMCFMCMYLPMEITSGVTLHCGSISNIMVSNHRSC